MEKELLKKEIQEDQLREILKKSRREPSGLSLRKIARIIVDIFSEEEIESLQDEVGEFLDQEKAISLEFNE
jgi:hypothetical protein